MILHNLDTLSNGVKSIRIDGERIAAVYSGDQAEGDGYGVYFENCIAYPGLINSHDHLDFNLFPQLGYRHYKNYLDWGTDLHKQYSDTIQTVLKIPKALRTQWGVYKNLLNGITTVVQHGEKLAVDDAPVNLFNGCYSLHSVGLEKRWKYQLNKPFIVDHPFVIHIGEGTDDYSFEEINRLLRWNLRKRKLIGIHGVAMNAEQASQFEALIWCPDSNFFTLGETAVIDQIKSSTKILFGTDSALSADWSIWPQLRKARATGLLTDAELIAAVSGLAASVWQLNDTGALKENHYADLVITKKKNSGDGNTEAFFASDAEDIQLVLNKGVIVHFDEVLLPQLRHIDLKKYSEIYIKGRCKYVLGRLDNLIKEIKRYAPKMELPIEIEEMKVKEISASK
jgi:cytosine/adenosine deaminase-related metal-dependent hydrolase